MAKTSGLAHTFEDAAMKRQARIGLEFSSNWSTQALRQVWGDHLVCSPCGEGGSQTVVGPVLRGSLDRRYCCRACRQVIGLYPWRFLSASVAPISELLDQHLAFARKVVIALAGLG